MKLTQVKFLHFTQTGKTATPIDCGKLYIFNAIPKAITKTSTQIQTFNNNSHQRFNRE